MASEETRGDVDRKAAPCVAPRAAFPEPAPALQPICSCHRQHVLLNQPGMLPEVYYFQIFFIRCLEPALSWLSSQNTAAAPISVRYQVARYPESPACCSHLHRSISLTCSRLSPAGLQSLALRVLSSPESSPALPTQPSY